MTRVTFGLFVDGLLSIFFVIKHNLLIPFSYFLHFAGTPADCTSLGVSKALFPSIPDLVVTLPLSEITSNSCFAHPIFSSISNLTKYTFPLEEIMSEYMYAYL